MSTSKRVLTFKEVNDLLRYDPETGTLTWKVGRSGTKGEGSVAGNRWEDCRNGKKYIRVGVLGFSYPAHRIAFLLMSGRWPKDQVDHINHDGTDNRFANLREVTQSENVKNLKQSSVNTSGFTGVCRGKTPGKWTASVGIGGVRRHLGTFFCFEKACTAREVANLEYGFHVNHGN